MSRRAALAAVLCLSLAASSARAQGQSCDVVPDLPFLRESALWARQTGMANASIAVGADISALHDNPAGLALIRRVEMAGNLNSSSSTVDLTAFGTTRSGTSRSMAINALAAAYPFPVYRGSLVVAGSYERPIGFSRLTVRSGVRPDPGAGTLIDERREESGGIHQLRAGAATDISREVAVGASITLSYARDTQTDVLDSTRVGSGVPATNLIDETLRTHAFGFGGNVGTLIRLSPYARVGATVATPRKLRFVGRGTDATGGFELVPQTFTLPMTVAGGIALTPHYAILAADVSYTDWSQLTYDASPCTGRLYYHLAPGYKAATDIRVGAEVWVPGSLLRLRAGWQSAPLAVAFLRDPTVAEIRPAPAYAPVEIVKDRRAWSVGAGYLIQGAYTLDVAYLSESYVRQTSRELQPWSGGTALRESTHQHQIVASVAFRI